jgi:hypothetical protein
MKKWTRNNNQDFFWGGGGVNTRFELRVPHLLGMHSPLVPHPQPFFPLVIFRRGSLVFARGWPQIEILLPMPHSWNYKHEPPWATMSILLVDVGNLLIFCPDWSWTLILPISASRVVWSTGVCHHSHPGIFFKYKISRGIRLKHITNP